MGNVGIGHNKPQLDAGLILALDLATVTGFALGNVSGIKVQGSRPFPRTGEDIGTFASSFRHWLIGGIRRHKPTLVVYEQPMLPTKTQLVTLRKLYGMAFLAELICRDEGVEVREAHRQQILTHFLGRGSVPRKREERQAAIHRQCLIRGWKPVDDNHADALALLDFAVAIMHPDSAMRAAPLLRGLTDGMGR